MKLIDKDALVAEIERRLDKLSNTSTEDNKTFAAVIGAQYYELISLVQYINALEVKGVDLEKNINSWYYLLNIPENYNIPQTVIVMDIVEKTAKHFFELGLKAKGE